MAVFSNAQALDEATALAVNCFTCHGPEGTSPGEIPSLQGKRAAYLLEKLRGFKSDSLPNTVMHRIVTGYDDSQLEAIAHLLGTTP